MPRLPLRRMLLMMLVLFVAACGRPDDTASNAAIQPSQPSAPTGNEVAPSPSVQQQMTAPVILTEQASPVADVPSPTPPPSCGTVSYVVNVKSLQERAALAEVIVVGDIVALGEVINSAFQVGDRTKPANDLFGVGQEYVFQVQRYIKGAGPNELVLLNDEGTVRLPPEKVTAQDIAQAKLCNVNPPFKQATTYLLFLNTIRYHNGKDYYYKAELPSRYIIQADDQVMMDEPVQAEMQMPQDLFSQPGKPFLAEVERAVAKAQAR